MKTKILPALYSLPELSTQTIGDRKHMLQQIESGELEHIEFDARVYRHDVKNRNHFTFRAEDLPAFCPSFMDKPFLRNHDVRDIGARDGIILSSELQGDEFHQRIRLTTRQGMTDYVEGRIDRFSIGWYADWIMCTVCKADWMTCTHWPGREYQTEHGKVTCELCFMNPSGKETSAVNANAVDGTGLLQVLEDLKHSSGAAVAPWRHGDTPQKGKPMDEDIIQPPTLAAQRLDENRKAAAELLGEQERIAALQAQVDESEQILIAQCQHLLDTGLQTSRLPAVVQKRIRKAFEGRKFKAPELHAAIEEARAEVSELTASRLIQGPARVGGMASTEDQLRAAVDDMFRIPRDESYKTVQPARLSGIRELYFMLTGDYNLHGGFYPDDMQLSTTADFTGLVKNALNKLVLQGWELMGQAGYDWWEELVTVEGFNSLQQITGTLIGTVGSLPTVLERGEYTEIVVGDSPETADFTKYGGYVPLTLELIDRDETRKIRNYGEELGKAGRRNISEQVAGIFTQNSAAGPTMADTGALFNSTAVTTAGGHANLLTTALGTDFTAWDAAAAAVYNQPLLRKNAAGYYGTGKKQAVEPKFCLVPRALKAAAEALFIPRWITQGVNTTSAQPSGAQTYAGFVKPKTVPEWTDATDWAAVCDPAIAPAIFVGTRFGLKPEIFVAGRDTDPAVFMNDEHRIKVRHFLAVWVNDFRPMHKNNVA